MNISFEGKVALVTGAASGMGLACSELLATSGAKVAMLDVDGQNLAKAVDRVQSKGVARGYPLNIADVPAIPATVGRIRQEVGEIDVLASCAGIAWPQTADTITEEDWDRILGVDAKGLFFCSKEVVVQSMMPRRTGSIVHISSLAGMLGVDAPLMNAHYHAAKSAVIGLTRQGAIEWAPYNIRVNAIAPGWTATPLVKPLLEDAEAFSPFLAAIPLGRVARPEDIAMAVCFLASDAASMITGVTLAVDGGQSTR